MRRRSAAQAPQRRQAGSWRLWLVLGLVPSHVTLGCATADGSAQAPERPFEGEIVTMFGPEVEDEQQSLKMAFAPFEEETGITIQLIGHRDFEERIDALVEGGNPPDIATFPQPGKVRDFADDVVPLPDDPNDDDDLGSTVLQSFLDDWTDPVTVDTALLAIPTKADFKSVIWYNPEQFRQHGYEVPQTFDAFLALAERMVQEGNTPFCLGLESEFATGWPLTDWIEDFLLRIEGPELYEDWYQHEVPFDDPDVVAVAERVYDLLSGEGVVYQGLERAAARRFADAGIPLLDGRCLMYRMANYYRPNWPENSTFGEHGDVAAFALPGTPENPSIALAGGTYAAAFSDDPAVMRTMAYLASEEFAGVRASTTTGGALSPNIHVSASQYDEPMDEDFSRMLAEAEPILFDASDLMPGAVGSGSFWRAAVDISTGEQTVADAFAEIEDSWPRE